MRLVALFASPLLLASATGALAQSPSPQVADGQRLYAEHCAQCHGADGRGGAGFQTPIWGRQTQIAKFGHAQGLFEYNQMLMPFDDPSKLTDDQKWALVAYILANHGTIERSATVGPQNAATIAIR